MKHSAGTLLYRRAGDSLEVLLVHPSGNYNRHKPWSIPKGLPDEGESLEVAARRETLEEAGVEAGDLCRWARSTIRKAASASTPSPARSKAANPAAQVGKSTAPNSARSTTPANSSTPTSARFLDRLEELIG